MKKVEAILEKNEAVEGFNTIAGYSLITVAYSSNMGFFFVQLKPWEERKTEEEHANGVVAALNRAFAQQIPEAGVVAFGPPAIPGSRHRRRLHDAAAGPQRRRARLSGRADAPIHGGGAKAARRSHASTRSTARRCRRSTPTSTGARSSRRASR